MATRTLRGGAPGEVFPIALIGIGIAWLIANNTGLTGSAAKNGCVEDVVHRRIGNMTSGGITSGGGIMSGPAEDIRDRDPGNGWAHQAVGAARNAVASLRDAGNAAVSRAAGYAADARDVARRASGPPVEKLDRDPWLFGVVGLVAGAVLAALVPPTRMERDIMEQARDGLNSKVAGLGRQAADCVRGLGESAVRAAQDRLREDR